MPYLSTIFVSPLPGSPLLSSPEASAPLLTKQQSCTRGSKNPARFHSKLPSKGSPDLPQSDSNVNSFMTHQGLSEPGPGPPESCVCQLCEASWALVTLPSTALIVLPPGPPCCSNRITAQSHTATVLGIPDIAARSFPLLISIWMPREPSSEYVIFKYIWSKIFKCFPLINQ